MTATPSQSTEFKPRRRPSDRPDVGKLFDRLPPSEPDAERSLLGSMLLDPEVVPEIIQAVSKPEQFYSEAHGAIFKALIDLYDKHQSGDLVQLSSLLQQRGVLDEVGGAEFLMELAEAVPSAVNAPHYARLVAESHRLRRLIDAAGEILHDAYHQAGVDSAKTIIDSAEKRIFDIAQEEESAEPETLHELLLQEMERLDRAEGKAISGLATGFIDLDEKLAGLQPGEMTILAARPSMGKTALALNLAEQIAFGGVAPGTAGSHEPVPVGLFSLEMSRQALVQRMLSARSGVDAHQLRTGAIGHHEWPLLQTACDELSGAPLYIDDSPGLTILALRAKARRMKQRHGVRCIIIDYLQLLTSPGSARESRQVEVADISRGIKALARELKIPIVCLAQLNRGSEQREGHRPRMSDLRESGSIEQDADVVMLLHREAYYHKGEGAWDPSSAEFDEDNRDKLNLTELIIAKQRNGPTGVVKLLWDEKITRFKNFQSSGTSSFGTREFIPPSELDSGSAFGSRPKTGPIDGHRDGGGPETSDDADMPPF